ncbi:MAG: molybdate ABC transporter substrate-binding protein [Pseudomonadota bacterium]|nr:molybdate ABC transporter substrate-binding protein [Pseudomonadota bacterium]
MTFKPPPTTMFRHPPRSWGAVTATVLFLWLWTGTAAAGTTTHVAIATNFMPAWEAIHTAFNAHHPHRATASFGATGQLAVQIRQGAPVDLFLAADLRRPLELVESGHGVADSVFVYARGRLVLWSRDDNLIDANGAVLQSERIGPLAIANPSVAPYGAAAASVLRELGVDALWHQRLVLGNNIAQTEQFVVTGNAPLGFISLAQWRAHHARRGSHWLVPEPLHPPIEQAGVLLQRGKDNPAAIALMQFLRSPEAAALLTELGYSRSSLGQDPQHVP